MPRKSVSTVLVLVTVQLGCARHAAEPSQSPASTSGDCSSAKTEGGVQAMREDRHDDGFKLLREGCECSEARSCELIAAHYFLGKHIRQDRKLATEYFERACAGGSAKSCEKAGVLYISGDEGLEKDEGRGARLLIRACELGVAGSCSGAGMAVGAGMAPGGARLTVQLLEKGCGAGDEPGCGALGELYVTGKAVPQDIPKGRELLRRACKVGFRPSCETLGRLESRDGGPTHDP